MAPQKACKPRWQPVIRTVQSEVEAAAKAKKEKMEVETAAKAEKEKMEVKEEGERPSSKAVPKWQPSLNHPWRKVSQQAIETTTKDKLEEMHPWRKALHHRANAPLEESKAPLEAIEPMHPWRKAKLDKLTALESDTIPIKHKDEDEDTAVASASSAKGEEETGSSQEETGCTSEEDAGTTPRSAKTSPQISEVIPDCASGDASNLDLMFGSIDADSDDGKFNLKFGSVDTDSVTADSVNADASSDGELTHGTGNEASASSDHEASNSSDHEASASSDHEASASSDHEASNSSDHEASASSDHEVSNSSDHEASASSDESCREVKSSDESSEKSKAKLAPPPGNWMRTPPATPPAAQVDPLTPPAAQVEPGETSSTKILETEQSSEKTETKQPLKLSVAAPLFKPGACVSDVRSTSGYGTGQKQPTDILALLRRIAAQAYPCQSWNLCVAAKPSSISGVTEAELILKVPPAAPAEILNTATAALHESLSLQAPQVEVQEYNTQSGWISFTYAKDPNRCCWEYLTHGYCPRMRTCRWPHLPKKTYIVQVKLRRTSLEEVPVPEFSNPAPPVVPDMQPILQDESWNSYEAYDGLGDDQSRSEYAVSQQHQMMQAQCWDCYSPANYLSAEDSANYLNVEDSANYLNAEDSMW